MFSKHTSTRSNVRTTTSRPIRIALPPAEKGDGADDLFKTRMLKRMNLHLKMTKSLIEGPQTRLMAQPEVATLIRIQALVDVRLCL